MKSKPLILVVLAVLVCRLAQPGPADAAEPARRPNILLIVADDLGYGDLGVQGCQDVPTPNIDSLAKNGIRFTSGYVSCPVCSPTRAGLMTGRYQQRFGHEFNPGPPRTAATDFGLSLQETPLPARLKSLGYATGMFGKWHLGYKPEFHPLKRGFDEYLGFLGGAHSYLDNREGGNAILRGNDPIEQVTYTTDMFGEGAAAFIEKSKDKPFFVYLPFNAVHMPLQATDKYLQRFRGVIKDQKRRTYAAMLSAMDDNVGHVLAKLREHGLEENTLIFFLSDNGGPTLATTSRNDPLRGYKGQVLEGGIRIPYIIQWKGHLPAGKVCDQPVISLDIHPTAVAAAGGALSPDWKLDGVNLLPFLAGEKTGPPHEALFWRYGPQHAVRKGDWKLLAQGRQAAPQLYNLARDIGEAHDLAAEEPGKVKELQAAYDQWNAQLVAPKWRNGGGKGKKAGKAGKAGKAVVE